MVTAILFVIGLICTGIYAYVQYYGEDVGPSVSAARNDPDAPAQLQEPAPPAPIKKEHNFGETLVHIAKICGYVAQKISCGVLRFCYKCYCKQIGLCWSVCIGTAAFSCGMFEGGLQSVGVA